MAGLQMDQAMEEALMDWPSLTPGESEEHS